MDVWRPNRGELRKCAHRKRTTVGHCRLLYAHSVSLRRQFHRDAVCGRVDTLRPGHRTTATQRRKSSCEHHLRRQHNMERTFRCRNRQVRVDRRNRPSVRDHGPTHEQHIALVAAPPRPLRFCRERQTRQSECNRFCIIERLDSYFLNCCRVDSHFLNCRVVDFYFLNCCRVADSYFLNCCRVLDINNVN